MGYYVQQNGADVAITKENWSKLHIDHPEEYSNRMVKQGGKQHEVVQNN